MLRAVSMLIASSLLMSCGNAMLPPREQLDSGCHVWFTSDGRSGIFAQVTQTGATVQRRGQTTEASLNSSGEVILEWSRSIPVARVEEQRLVVTDLGDQFTPAFVADLDAASTEIALRRYESNEPWTKLHRSASCTPTQTAIGAGPVAYYVNWEFRMQTPPAHEYDDPKRADR